MKRDQIGNMVLACRKMNEIIEQPLDVKEYQQDCFAGKNARRNDGVDPGPDRRSY